jgi:glycosyltransferase involved in cell wall biosynthesis
MHQATDKRVHYKEAISLVKAGFEVHHVCPGDGAAYVLDGVQVQTFRHRPTLGGRMAAMRQLYRLAAATGADAYHCNEMDSWVIGVVLKIARRKPLIFDVHEIYSSNLAETRFPPALRPAVMAAVRAAYRAFLPFTDRLVLAKGSVTIDFPKTRVPQLVVANYVEVTPEDKTAAIAAHDHSALPFTLIHIGLIGRARGWPQLLDALKRSDSRIQLKVVGTFNDGSLPQFEAAVRSSGLEDRVTVTAWIPYEQVHRETLSAAAGVIIFQPVRLNHTHALPHKLFDYMRAAIPVIVPGFAVEVAQIVRDADCGLIVDPTDAAAVADAMNRLLRDPDLRQRLGKNGREAVLRRYNWDIEAAKLVRLYQSLADQGRKPAADADPDRQPGVSEKRRAG